MKYTRITEQYLIDAKLPSTYVRFIRRNKLIDFPFYALESIVGVGDPDCELPYWLGLSVNQVRKGQSPEVANFDFVYDNPNVTRFVDGRIVSAEFDNHIILMSYSNGGRVITQKTYAFTCGVIGDDVLLEEIITLDDHGNIIHHEDGEFEIISTYTYYSDGQLKELSTWCESNEIFNEIEKQIYPHFTKRD